MQTFALDSSALIAILLREPEAAAFNELLNNAQKIYISAVTVLETSLVLLAKKSTATPEQFQGFLRIFNPEVVAFDVAQSQIAIQAAHIYGKGRHPASLNFGDCCSYALAKSLGLPLLFKGNDFSQTDLRAVV
jgi:ribonuclease VapC